MTPDERQRFLRWLRTYQAIWWLMLVVAIVGLLIAAIVADVRGSCPAPQWEIDSNDGTRYLTESNCSQGAGYDMPAFWNIMRVSGIVAAVPLALGLANWMVFRTRNAVGLTSEARERRLRARELAQQERGRELARREERVRQLERDLLGRS